MAIDSYTINVNGPKIFRSAQTTLVHNLPNALLCPKPLCYVVQDRVESTIIVAEYRSKYEVYR